MKWIKWMLLFGVSMFMISCTKEVSLSAPTFDSHKKNQYEIIKKPEYALSKDMKQMFIISNAEMPYFIFRMHTFNQDSFLECKWNGEKKWSVQKTEWSNLIANRYKNYECQIASADGENLYILLAKKNNYTYELYRVSKKGEIQRLHMPDIYARVKGQTIISFDVIRNSRLVFFFSKKEDAVCGQAIEYDANNEKFLSKDGKIDDISAGFDNKGNYYLVAPRQQLILKKSLYEEIPQKVIKCDGITSECINSQMIIDEEFGYVLTGSGIYGGKLDADRWEKILDRNKMLYCKEFGSPVLGIANMVKAPGQDTEFYLMTWKNRECSDFEWIHYFS